MRETTRVFAEIEGDLARALLWEAERRVVPVGDLIRRLVRDASFQCFVAWRHAHRNVAFLEPRRGVEAAGPYMEVVRKAQGPTRS